MGQNSPEKGITFFYDLDSLKRRTNTGRNASTNRGILPQHHFHPSQIDMPSVSATLRTVLP